MKTRKHATLRAFLFIVFLSVAPAFTPAFAQGCTQCRDNTAATPPSTQRAYRHAIVLMTIAGGGLFLATVALLKNSR